MGFWDVVVEDLPDPAMQFAAQPQVSGVGRHGSTLSLQSMARDGVRLMGRLSDVEDGVLKTDDSLAEHIAYADERSAEFTGLIENWIVANGFSAEPIEDDPNDEPAGPEVAASGITELDLSEAGVGSVIWCTGFTAPSRLEPWPEMNPPQMAGWNLTLRFGLELAALVGLAMGAWAVPSGLVRCMSFIGARLAITGWMILFAGLGWLLIQRGRS